MIKVIRDSEGAVVSDLRLLLSGYGGLIVPLPIQRAMYYYNMVWLKHRYWHSREICHGDIDWAEGVFGIKLG